jgi:hypothetical protein
VGASVVAGVDAAPVFQLAEHVLDFVALAVERAIMGDRHFAVHLRRNARDNTAFGQGIAEPASIVTPVAEQSFGSWQGIEHQRGPLVVAHLAFAEQHHQRTPLTVADGVKLGVQAALRAPDTSGNSPFFSRLAAVRCALRWVASIINWSGLPPFAASAANIRLNTPRRLQRIKRLCLVAKLGGVEALPINRVLNGGFEAGNLSGWTQTGGGTCPVAAIITDGVTGSAFGEAIPSDPLTTGSPDLGGRYAAYFVDDSAHQSLNQTIFLAAGNYEIGFDVYDPRNGYNNPV